MGRRFRVGVQIQPQATTMAAMRAGGWIKPGGLVVVSDVFFADHSRTSPPFATYFALNMMLMAEHGSAHAKTEMAAWLRAAGFTQVEIRDLPPPNPHSLVLGIKP